MTRPRLLILLTLTLLPFSLLAQRQVAVYNLETHLPERDVVLYTDGGYADTTDYRGLAIAPDSFNILTFRKSGFTPVGVTPEELTDTVYMLPSLNAIDEVTVWGENQESIGKMEEGARVRNLDDELQEAYDKRGVIAEFDLSKMLDRRSRRDAKHRKKARQVIKELDKKRVKNEK